MHYAPRRRRLRRQGVVNLGLAALVVALLVAGARLALRHGAASPPLATEQNAALTALATSAFRSASFDRQSTDSPRATALYASDGRWLYVVVARAPFDCEVVDASGGVSRVLGRPRPLGTVSTLYVTATAKPSLVLLVHGGRTLATATLAY